MAGIRILGFYESIKNAASEKYGEPPYGHAESSSLKMFSSKENLDLNRALELLQSAGIQVSGEKAVIKDIAAAAGKSPQEIYQIIKPASLTPPEGEDQPKSPQAFLEGPKSGWGKRIFSEVCDEYGLDSERLIQGLKEKGIEAEPDASLKDIAAANDTGPMQIYEAMRDLVAAELEQ